MLEQQTGTNFSLEHYMKTISLMRAKSYKFRLIGDSTAGDRLVFMRHDIDLSLTAARKMAEVDKASGISSTFYFMVRSNFYNLFSTEAKGAIHYVANLGHRLGLHFVGDENNDSGFNPSHLEAEIQNEFSTVNHYYPDIFWKTVSFHNPPKQVFGLKLANYVNAYEDRYFRAVKYLSESNQKWREGDLYPIIAEGRYNKLQILIHPALWVFGGNSLTATMESFLASEKGNWERFIREDGIPF